MLKNKYFITLTYLFTVLLVLIGSSYLFKSVEHNNKNKLYSNKYQALENYELLNYQTSSDPIIKEIIISKNSSDQLVILFITSNTNSFGEIEALIGVDTNGVVVLAEAIRVDQTFSQAELGNLIINMEDKTITNSVGNVAGVTIGSQTISDIFDAVALEYEKIFTYQKMSTDNQEGVISKKAVKLGDEVVATIYELEKKVPYENGITTMNITVKVDNLRNVINYQINKYESTSESIAVIELSDMLALIGGN